MQHSSPTLGDAAHDLLRHAIVRLELAPGAAISEQQLVDGYGLNKAAVRTALTRLKSEGLVSAGPRGHTVAPITLRDVEEIYDLRLTLEPGAAKIAAGRLPPNELDRLRGLVAEDPDLDQSTSVDRFLEANRAVHVSVAEATDNGRLLDIVTRLLDDSERVLLLALRAGAGRYGQRVKEEHQALLSALAGGRSDEAEAVMAAGIGGFRDELVRMLLASPAVKDRALHGSAADLSLHP